jgi:hypothetical protein
MWTIDRTGSKAIVTVKADHKSDIEFAIEEVMGKEGIEVRHLHLIMSRALDISDLLTIEYYCPPDELEHGEDYGVRYMKPFNSVTVSGQQGPDALPLHPKWVADVRQQCADAGVEFRLLNWGEWIPKTEIADFIRDKEPYGWRVRDEWLPAIRKTATQDVEWGTLNASGEYYPDTTTWNGNQMAERDDYEVSVWRVGVYWTSIIATATYYTEREKES